MKKIKICVSWNKDRTVEGRTPEQHLNTCSLLVRSHASPCFPLKKILLFLKKKKSNKLGPFIFFFKKMKNVSVLFRSRRLVTASAGNAKIWPPTRRKRGDDEQWSKWWSLNSLFSFQFLFLFLKKTNFLMKIRSI